MKKSCRYAFRTCIATILVEASSSSRAAQTGYYRVLQPTLMVSSLFLHLTPAGSPVGREQVRLSTYFHEFPSVELRLSV